MVSDLPPYTRLHEGDVTYTGTRVKNLPYVTVALTKTISLFPCKRAHFFSYSFKFDVCVYTKKCLTEVALA